jgi:hypothetical protein
MVCRAARRVLDLMEGGNGEPDEKQEPLPETE